MPNKLKKFGVVILAAGQGKRMKSNLPKVAVPLKGRPMIEYLVKSCIESGIDKNPVVVVSSDNKDIISEILKNYDCRYAIQSEQLGTGHALACAKSELADANKIISFYGDHPFVSPATVKKLAGCHNGVITLMTVTVSNFDDWQKVFYNWARIIRRDGQIKAIVEFKDAIEEIKKIKEVNPGFYCFDSQWLWQNIDNIKNNNVQQEYYLTDLIKFAFEQNQRINSTEINIKEAVGINKPEELAIAEKLILDSEASPE